MKIAADHFIAVRHPFPLMGKGRDRGTREPMKSITPTFILPRRGEGISAALVRFITSQPIAHNHNPIFEGDAEDAEAVNSETRWIP